MFFKKVTIIGLGLIGGSLAWGLKKTGQIEEVTGVDIDEDTLEYAVNKNIVDNVSSDPNEAVRNTDLVVVATHVGLIPKVVNSLIANLSAKTTITDVGSIKEDIVKEIEGFLPSDVHFVGGHPIAGSERSGISYSDGELFIGKECVLTPTSRTDKESLNKVDNMWKLVGSNVITMDPQYHDRVFAYVSHLPHVVAYALINSVGSARGGDKIFSFAGGGLKDFTRISESSPELWSEILLANKHNILESLEEFKKEIEKIQGAMEEEDFKKLKGNLSKAVNFKQNID